MDGSTRDVPEEYYVPATLSSWTLGTVKRLLQADVSEDGRFDWKEMLPREGGGRDRIVECAVAMANNGGGFMVFGVADQGEGEQRIVGVEMGREFGNRFDNLVRQADPAVPYEIKKLSLGDGRWLQIVQVDARLAPHSFRGTFFKRTGGGADGFFGTTELRRMFVAADVREAVGLAEIDKVAFRFNRLRPWPMVEQDLETLSSYASEGTQTQKLAVLVALERLAVLVRQNMPGEILHAMFCLLHAAMPNRRAGDERLWRRGLELSIDVVGNIGYAVVLYLKRGPAVVEVGRLLSEALARAREEGEPALAALAVEAFDKCEEAAGRAQPAPFNDAATWLRFKRTFPSLFERAPPPELSDVEARLFGLDPGPQAASSPFAS